VEPWLASLVIIACLGAEAFFSGAEIALYSANKLKIRHSPANSADAQQA
jgi:CBS domain containing-hemolysin-like protein